MKLEKFLLNFFKKRPEAMANCKLKINAFGIIRYWYTLSCQ